MHLSGESAQTLLRVEAQAPGNRAEMKERDPYPRATLLFRRFGYDRRWRWNSAWR
jgi:hypothetical protein